MLYLVGQTTSGAGSALSSVALVFAVLSISRSAGSVGLVLLSSRLPGIALTLAGGVIADRWSRKWIAVGADTTRTVLQMATGFLCSRALRRCSNWRRCRRLRRCNAMFGPAANALLAGVAPRGQIRRASSLLVDHHGDRPDRRAGCLWSIVALAGPGTSLLIDARPSR